MTRARLLVAVLLLVGCGRSREVPVLVEACGPLSADTTPRTSENFHGTECAVGARVQVEAVGGVDAGAGNLALLDDRCLDFRDDPQTGAPSPVQLANLFDTGSAGAARLLGLGDVQPGVQFTVEVSLYGSGATLGPSLPPCADGLAVPILALGRSSVVDLATDDHVDVPLGIRQACNERAGVTLKPVQLETGAMLAMPEVGALGDIFAWDALESTGGLCSNPVARTLYGSFRAFPLATQDSTTPQRITGDFAYDTSGFAGCVAARIDGPHGTTYACLANPSNEEATIALLTDEHLMSVVAANQATKAQHGALVLQIPDITGAPAVGARVQFDLFERPGRDADYPMNDDWSEISSTTMGTSEAEPGIAIFPNAPTGPYTVFYADGTTTTLHAGGAADPLSVTTLLVAPPQ